MSDEKPPLVRQVSNVPTRKVGMGGINGASAVVGLNLLATVIMNRAYGGIENVPESELQLILWLVSSIPVAIQFGVAWITRSRAYPVERAE